ncbi:hypothetical protein ACO0RG_002453 [Hanseniaspora osmophila]
MTNNDTAHETGLQIILPAKKQLFQTAYETLKSKGSSVFECQETISFPEIDIESDKYKTIDLFLSQLNHKNDVYKTTHEKSKKVEQSFEELKENLTIVQNKGTVFYSNIGESFERYNGLVKEKELILQYLTVFQNLTDVTKKLNNLNLKFLSRKKENVVSIANKLFESLDFLEQHATFKDYENYKFKFKQQLVKLCDTLVKYLIQIFLQNAINDVSANLAKLNESSNAQSARETLLYNKFAMNCNDFSFFQNIILNSFVKYGSTKFFTKDLQRCMEQTYNNYFEMREKLLKQYIWLQVDAIVLNDKDNGSLMKFIQDNILYFSSLFEKELEIFNKFFNQDFDGKTDVLNEWFMSLCEPFYDSCRIRVIRESNISLLCDCVTLLSKYYEFEDGSQEYEIQFKHIKFNKIFEPIIQDIQSRLIFKSQLYVEKNIINYKPSSTEFQITGGKQSLAQLRKKNLINDDNAELLNQYLETLLVFNTEVNHSYYLPMLKSLALLSKLYQMISSTIFDELAHQIVHDGLVSMELAWQKSGKPTLDKTLVYLSNLLFFKDQIQNFDIQYVSTETYIDFSGVNGLWNLLNSTIEKTSQPPQIPSRFDRENGTLSNTLTSLANNFMPKVVNNMLDARTELIVELRNVINLFTQLSTDLITKNLFNKESREADEVGNSSNLVQSVEEEIPRIFKEISLHFNDETVISQLMQSVKENLIAGYLSYFNDTKLKVETKEPVESSHEAVVYPEVFNNLVSDQIDPYLTQDSYTEASAE